MLSQILLATSMFVVFANSNTSAILTKGRALVDVPPSPPDEQEPLDSDRDGLSDELESRTGTDPLNQDTDFDGVSDGVEDRDQDGAWDRGESNPRSPGLHPGRAPHIPEPMSFDLVRGLRSRAGELESNALLLWRHKQGRSSFEWAPQIEWAPADDLAVQVEAKIDGDRAEAVKFSAQGSDRRLYKPGSAVHAWQMISETQLQSATSSIAALYLGAVRAGRFSTLWMLGVRFGIVGRDPVANALVVNQSWMWDVHERVTVGSELNVDAPNLGTRTSVRVLPQLHFQVGQRLRLQFGAGADLDARAIASVFGLRLIVE